jgi:UV DNA damage endonuclease
MLEVKDKNLSAVKCILLTKENVKINSLENEWSRFKYFVLSRSVIYYNSIRDGLKDKGNPNALVFYTYIEEALNLNENVGAEVNAAQHVWGYVSEKASTKDKIKFDKLINQYSTGKVSVRAIKNFLFRLAKEQSFDYLLESLYFYV